MRASLTLLLLAAAPAQAQNFTTAAEVRPILEATRAGWIALREFDGRDLLYFTHLEAWRCGLSGIEYAVNGGEMQAWEVEPCYEGEAQPNAIRAEGRQPYTGFGLGSVQSVDVRVTFDDGTVAEASYTRDAVMMP
ncbi:hypothetical protein PSA7680_01587 [Pseudoruegeria aquimaris]|uniref:Uncharacterized protein n=1 Tax=Pseudoruegeria aquimaris TaxID=393663 RepID=A0A1Y5S6M5_9RHOB|nr:hypothetical protein [Pseudoruegeria aquimaris]SLN33725.1 hypothetical protein PSA7680_01587 [Pseudoruegeria aquimaris]